MPELPEVETVCRIMRRVLVGDRIVGVDVANDEIVLGGVPSSAIRKALLGRQITEVGRKGKYWWLAISDGPYLFGHLGMSGWIRELGQATIRLQSHGSAALDGVDGLPKFLKLLIVTEAGGRIAFTDGRRLGRLWLGESPETDSRIQRLPSWPANCQTERSPLRAYYWINQFLLESVTGLQTRSCFRLEFRLTALHKV